MKDETNARRRSEIRSRVGTRLPRGTVHKKRETRNAKRETRVARRGERGPSSDFSRGRRAHPRELIFLRRDLPIHRYTGHSPFAFLGPVRPAIADVLATRDTLARNLPINRPQAP